jgi:hypothetical protein
MSEAETKSETKVASPSKTSIPGVHQHVVPTERCGALSVYVQVQSNDTLAKGNARRRHAHCELQNAYLMEFKLQFIA